MASREKRALAPSKSRQKANNDSSISLSSSSSNSNNQESISNRVTKRSSLATANSTRNSQLAEASVSPLSSKLVEANLPRKRAVLQTALKRKQKARKTLIKAKQKQQQVVTKAGLKRLAALDAKIGGLKGRRRNNATAAAAAVVESVVETKYKCKTANKKNKTLVKVEVHQSEDQTSPKLSRRVLNTISPRSKRVVKPSRKARNNLELIKKESEIIQIKQEIKSETEDEDEDEEEEEEEEDEQLGEDEIKSEPIIDNSIDDTIDQVIASSMLVDAGVARVKVEKEESEGAEVLRGRTTKNARSVAAAKRSLRNGKLRANSAKVDPADASQKKANMSEASLEISANLDGETAAPVVVKVETPMSEDESVAVAAATTNNHCNENSEHETNNNNGAGCEETSPAEIGPTLRSKTKARNSDSSSETSEDVKPPMVVVVAASATPATSHNNNKALETVTEKKERTTLAKLNEVKSSISPSPATQNSSATAKGRRNSLNTELRRTPLCSDKLSGKDLDDMVNKIKFSISKAIESKAIFQTENKPPALLAKNFDAKVEEVVAPLSNDSTVKSRLDEDVVSEDNSNAAKSRDLGIGPSLTNKELSSEGAENNTVPKVADTAKEIEKLVMGDIEPADSKPPPPASTSSEEGGSGSSSSAKPSITEETASTPAVEAKTEEQEEKKSKVETKQVETSCSDDGVEKDKQQQQPESSGKKAAVATATTTNCVKRKSPRSAGKTAATAAAVADAKKLEEAASNATTEEAPNKTLSSENDEGQEENKTVPAAKDSTTVAAKSSSSGTESDEKKTEALPEKMDVDSAETEEKGEETLESLYRDVKRLVETNQSMDEENDASADDEMRLVIDDSTSETLNEAITKFYEVADNAVNQGCDQKSSNEGSSDVQKVNDDATAATASAATDAVAVEPTAKASVVPENTESEKTDTADSPAKTESKANTTTTAKVSKVAEAEKVEEQKETTRRSLRTRGDKQKKVEIAKPVPNAHDKSDNKKSEDAATSAEVPSTVTTQASAEPADNSQKATNDSPPSNEVAIKIEPEEPTIRTRRSREVKRTPPTPVPVSTKGKRGPKKQEAKKADNAQQNKEDSLLDNEVAKINENTRRPSSCLPANDNARGVSANADSSDQKQQHAEDKNRSKSENDMASSSAIPAEEVAAACSAAVKSNQDEGSTDGDSSSGAEQIQETPEDRAKKEAVLRQLGLESWERVKEREAKKGVESKSESPKQQSSGSLKTVIRLQKDKDGKKRPRSPIKMVFNKQSRVDGEESSEFYKYTIQRETESGGMGESSSGANRKLPTTNPRHSCDNNDENEETPIKDRQSLVIPEKSSSFSIHPERLCSDNCCYCYGKFGSLDTPMHLAQMKSDERRNKILVIETHITPDSCLCDACYRHIDRKANASPTTLLTKPQRRNTHFHETKCIVRECNAPVKSHVKRRWLVKIKSHLMAKDDKKEGEEEEMDERDEEDIKWKININWKAAQHNLVPFCEFHYGEIARFLKCVVCKRRLPRNNYFALQLSDSAIQKFNNRLSEMGIPTVVAPDTFYCKLCKFFTKLSFQPLEALSESNRNFVKNYRKRLLYCFEVEYESEEEDEQEMNPPMDKKRKDPGRLSISGPNKKSKSGRKRSKSPTDHIETMSTSASDKSTPEPPRHDIIEPEVTIKEESAMATISTAVNTESRCLSIEGAIEKLKKRKNLETVVGPSLLRQEPSNVMEILSRDKEVTLTRLPPKKPRLDTPSNDITPVVQRLGNNPSISVRTLFPGEEEMNLQAGVEFNNIREVTPQGWEKCMTVVQYDKETKLLWQELQRPYGNMSSFLRHLVLLEKYYRSGDLILAPNASRNAINYSTSVQNRLISYEGPEKMDEPLALDTQSTMDYNNSRRLSGGYILENRSSQPQPSTSTSASNFVNVTAQLSKLEPSSKPVKLTPVVSIIKKPPPNLQRLNTSGSGVNGSAKRKESVPVQKVQSGSNIVSVGGKLIQLSEPEYKRFQSLKKQKQIMNVNKSKSSSGGSSGGSSSSGVYNKANAAAYAQKTQQHQLQLAQQQSQFQKHWRMQQEMYARAGRSDFEPLVCDIRLANENTPTQNLINTLNLPKSIQVTTKTTSTSVGPMPTAASTPIPILPKIPKSLTVIPQTVPRYQSAQDK